MSKVRADPELKNANVHQMSGLRVSYLLFRKL